MISKSNLFDQILINQVRFWFRHHSRADVEKSAHEFFIIMEKFRTENIEFLTSSPRQLKQQPVLNFLFDAAKFYILKNQSTFDNLFNSPLPLDDFAEDHFSESLVAIRILKEALEWATEHLSNELFQIVIELKIAHCLVKTRSENFINHLIEAGEIFTRTGNKLLAKSDQNLDELLGNSLDGLGMVFLSLARGDNALRSSVARHCFEAASKFYKFDLVDQCRLKVIFATIMEAYSTDAFTFYSGLLNDFSSQNQKRLDAIKQLKSIPLSSSRLDILLRQVLLGQQPPPDPNRKRAPTGLAALEWLLNQAAISSDRSFPELEQLGEDFMTYDAREAAIKAWDLALRTLSPPDEAANHLIKRALQIADSIPDFDPLFHRELCTHAVDHAMTDQELFMAFQHMAICNSDMRSEEITLREDLRRKTRACDQDPKNILGLAGEILSLQRQCFGKSPVASSTLMDLDEACKLAEETQSAIVLMTSTRMGLVSFVVLPDGKFKKVFCEIKIKKVSERLAEIRQCYFTLHIDDGHVIEFLKRFDKFLELLQDHWSKIISSIKGSTLAINIVSDGLLYWIPHHAVVLQHGDDAGARLGLQYHIAQAPTITRLKEIYQKERSFLSAQKSHVVIAKNGIEIPEVPNNIEVHEITTLMDLIVLLKQKAVHCLFMHGEFDLTAPFTKSRLLVRSDRDFSRPIDFLRDEVAINGPVVAWVCESAGPDPFSLQPSGLETALIMAGAPAVISPLFVVPVNEHLVGSFLRTLLDEFSENQTAAFCLNVARSHLDVKDPWKQLTFLAFRCIGCAVGEVQP